MERVEGEGENGLDLLTNLYAAEYVILVANNLEGGIHGNFGAIEKQN